MPDKPHIGAIPGMASPYGQIGVRGNKRGRGRVGDVGYISRLSKIWLDHHYLPISCCSGETR